jgi:uncharacterized protein (DUF1697 family)
MISMPGETHGQADLLNNDDIAMKTFIAMLRAVNLAGHNRVSMADLCRLLTDLGLKDGRSLLQSGNLVFRDDDRASEKLESLLEDAAAKRLGLKTDFFVRTAADLKMLIAGNPFPEEAREDPSHLLVMFLKEAPDAKAVAVLQKSIKGRELIRAKGRQAYIVYPDGIGRSRLTTAVLERGLATRGTARNWNTILKLDAFASQG